MASGRTTDEALRGGRAARLRHAVGVAGLLAAAAAALSAPPAAASLVAVAAGDAIHETGLFGVFGGGDEVVAVAGLARVQDVDYANGRYFWTDVQTGKLQTAVRGSTTIEDLVVRAPSGSVPRFLEVDSAGGKLYWTEARLGFPVSGDAHVYRSDLDGSNAERIYTTASGSGSLALGDLVLDPGCRAPLPPRLLGLERERPPRKLQRAEAEVVAW